MQDSYGAERTVAQYPPYAICIDDEYEARMRVKHPGPPIDTELNR